MPDLVPIKNTSVVNQALDHYHLLDMMSACYNYTKSDKFDNFKFNDKSKISNLGPFGHDFFTWSSLKNIRIWDSGLTACRYIQNSFIFCDHFFFIIWTLYNGMPRNLGFVAACLSGAVKLARRQRCEKKMRSAQARWLILLTFFLFSYIQYLRPLSVVLARWKI